MNAGKLCGCLILEWVDAIIPLLKDDRNKFSIGVYKGYNITTLSSTVTVSTADYCITAPITAREMAQTLEDFTKIVLKPIADFINQYENKWCKRV